jgi:hypothetical protein
MSQTSTLDLPPTQQAVLDAATVECLFRDIGACTEVLSLSLRCRGQRRGGEFTGTLDDARGAFVDGTAQGIQIRYRHQGEEWWDTLMRISGEVRLVRMRAADALSNVTT